MIDKTGRVVDYMRVSVTQQCNLRCVYCMPEDEASPADGAFSLPGGVMQGGAALQCGGPEGGAKLEGGLPGCAALPDSGWEDGALTLKEIVRLCTLFVRLGVDRFKLTGGEPLLYPLLPRLARELYEKAGAREVTLTTNGILLKERAESLKDAGIRAVNVSLDTLKEQRFLTLCRRRGLHRALSGIETARELGLQIKLNCTLLQGMNEDEIGDFLRFSDECKVPVRFIELMPIGEARGYTGIGRSRILEEISALYPGSIVEPVSIPGNGPAEYYRVSGTNAVIGFISPLSHKFCASCNRLRLTSKGWLRTCLDAEEGSDLKKQILDGATDEAVLARIRRAILEKPAGHHFDREYREKKRSRTMNRIGG